MPAGEPSTSTATPSAVSATPVTFVPNRTFAPAATAWSSRMRARSGRYMPPVAGKSGPPVFTSGSSATTGASGPGARSVSPSKK